MKLIGSSSESVLAILLSSFFITMMIPASGSDGGSSTSDRFPVIGLLGNASVFSTSFTQTREIMAWDGDVLYHTYIALNSSGYSAVFIRTSSDSGATWDDPVQYWNWTYTYVMASDLFVHNGTMMLFVFIALDNTFESRSLSCIEFPISEYGNLSAVKRTRIDSELPGFMPMWKAVEFEGKVYIFWVRSHYMLAYYRTYEGGTWGNTTALDTGTYLSNFAAIVTDISGTNEILFVYQYYPEGKVYATHSSDGRNWSSVQTLFYNSEGAARLDYFERNGTLHLVLNERYGNDIYYTNTTNARNWSSLLDVGDGCFQDTPNIVPDLCNVAITFSENTGSMLIAYEANHGIMVMESSDNGVSFNKSTYLYNESRFRYPQFDPKGLFLLHMDSNDTLYMRAVGWDLADDNTTPPDNDTTPGNDTGGDDDDDDVPGNDTGGDDDDDTAPGNDTGGDTDTNDTGDDDGVDTGGDTDTNDTGDDDDDDPDYWNQPGEGGDDGKKNVTLQDIEPSLEGIDASSEVPENGGDLILRAPAVPSHLTVNYTWFEDGRIIGYGPEIPISLSPGVHTITLRMMDQNGYSVEKSITIDIPGSKGGEDIPLIYLIGPAAVIILLGVALSLFYMRGRRSTVRPDPTEDQEEQVIDPEVRSGSLLGLSYLERTTMGKDLHEDLRTRRENLLRRAMDDYAAGHMDEETYYSIKEMLEPGQE